MELIQATVFLPFLIVAVTQMMKELLPTIKDWLTILVAILLGVIVALVDTTIGVVDISIAQGVMIGLEAVGISVIAKKAAGE